MSFQFIQGRLVGGVVQMHHAVRVLHEGRHPGVSFDQAYGSKLAYRV